MKLKLCIIVSLVFLCIPFNISFAACDKTDPCAPKIEKGSWRKSIAFGFNLTSGNSDTTLLTIHSTVARETDADLIDFAVRYNYGQDKNAENENGDNTTRDDLKVNVSYNFKLTPLWYTGFGTQYARDEITDITYRINLDPTIGYFIIKNDDLSFALETGPSYIFEEVGDERKEYLSPRLANNFSWIISCTSKLFQKAEFLFDTEDSQNYMVNAEFGIEAAISSQLSLVLGVKNQYDHQPADDKDENDLQMISALKVNL